MKKLYLILFYCLLLIFITGCAKKYTQIPSKKTFEIGPSFLVGCTAFTDKSISCPKLRPGTFYSWEEWETYVKPEFNKLTKVEQEEAKDLISAAKAKLYKWNNAIEKRNASNISTYPPKRESINSNSNSWNLGNLLKAYTHSLNKSSRKLSKINNLYNTPNFNVNSSFGNNRSGGCSSDLDCGLGNRCVKATYSTYGTCMKSVDSTGLQQFNNPSSNIGPNYNRQCNFNPDCPPGFSCIGGNCVK